MTPVKRPCWTASASFWAWNPGGLEEGVGLVLSAHRERLASGECPCSSAEAARDAERKHYGRHAVPSARRGLGRVGSLFLLRYGAVGLGILTSILWTRCAPMRSTAVPDGAGAADLRQRFCLQGMGSSMAVAAAKGYDGNLAPVLRTKLLAGVAGAVAVAGVAFHWRADSPELFWPTLVGQRCSRVDHGRDDVLLAERPGADRAAVRGPVRPVGGATGLPGRGAVGRGVVSGGASGLHRGAPGAAGRGPGRGHPAPAQQHHARRGVHPLRLAHLGGPAGHGLLATDKLLLGDSLGPEDVAVYAVALVFPQQFNTIFSIVNQMLTPDMYKADSVAGAWAAIKPRLPGIGAAFVAIGLVGFAAFPVLIPLLFSAKYVAAVPYGKWLWLSLSVLAPLTLLSNILKAQQKTGFVYFMGAFQPLLQFGLYVALLGHASRAGGGPFRQQVIVGHAYRCPSCTSWQVRRMAATREASGRRGRRRAAVTPRVLYLCAFAPSVTMSNFQDYADAFARAGARVANLARTAP
jgi:hypothetical protein